MPASKAGGDTVAAAGGFDWPRIRERISASLARADPARQMDEAERQQILRRRAEALARPAKDAADLAAIGLIGIRCGSQVYGVSVDQADAVVRSPVLPVPGVADIHAGLVNHRGKIVTVIDVGRLLGYGAATSRAQCKVLVIAVDGRHLGLLAEEVIGIHTFTERDISPHRGAGDLDSHLAVVGMTSGGWLILDAAYVVRDSRLVVDEEVHLHGQLGDT